MTHTGIRLKITVPGGTILDADSDWLHMNALMHGAQHFPESMAELMSSEPPAEFDWVEVAQLVGGPIQIWIQPANLADEHPDDEGDGEDFCQNDFIDASVVCELRAGHAGPHYGTLEWGPHD